MNVKLGINLLLWSANVTAEHLPLFEKLKSAGFDGIEIPVVGQPDADIQAMRRELETLDLACTTSTFITPDVNPIDPDAAVRAAAIETLKQRIDQCAALESDLLIGGIYQAHKYFVGRAATEQEWQWSADYLRAAGEYAQSMGVRLGLEFLNRFEVFLINTAADAKRMCVDVGLDNVGVLYDTHHANIEDPVPEIAIGGLGGHLMHVHLSESHRGTLGTGQVPWHDTFKALADADYNGWLTIEAFGMADPDIVNAANIWREAFDSPEQLYRDGIGFIKDSLTRGT